MRTLFSKVIQSSFVITVLTISTIMGVKAQAASSPPPGIQNPTATNSYYSNSQYGYLPDYSQYYSNMQIYLSNIQIYLHMITDNTYNILQMVNKLPDYIDLMGKLANSWLATESDPDNSTIAATQAQFATLGYLFSQGPTDQFSLQQQLMADILHIPSSDFSSSDDNPPKIRAILPNVNDLSYATIRGLPPASGLSSSTYNYIINVLGANINHPLPEVGMEGDPRYIEAYTAYYNNIIASQSFSAYVLSSLLTENQPNKSQEMVQDALIRKASDSAWLANVATYELGKVLRDILLFESQSYVLLSQQLKIQKQLLMAQAMTNSLLVTTNISTEEGILRNARKKIGT